MSSSTVGKCNLPDLIYTKNEREYRLKGGSVFVLNERISAADSVVAWNNSKESEFHRKFQKELEAMKDGSSSFCAVVYEHENFGGALWAWGKQHESDDISGSMISRRSWHGHLKGWSGKDVSWNDQISSVVVAIL